jgi:hypothetical protein
LKDLRDHAVAYLNTDGNGRVPQHERSHSLERFSTAWRATSAIRRPSAFEAAASGDGRASTPEEKKDARERLTRIEALGSGPTHAVSTARRHRVDQHQLRRRRPGRHLPLDLRRFLLLHRFLDTDFAYGRVPAQTVGTAVIRLVADVSPFEFTNPADTVQKYGHN